MNIHLWVPDYAGSAGGIQLLSRFTIEALRQIGAVASIGVIVKNDVACPSVTKSRIWFSASGRWPRRVRTAIYSLKLIWFALTDRPQLIWITHAHFSPVAYVLRKFLGIPFVVVGHGVEVWNISRANVRQGIRMANTPLAVSEFTRSRMAAAAEMPRDSIRVLPNTFDADRFHPGPKPTFLLRRYGLDAGDPIILTVARLEPNERYKGHDQVLRALPNVRSQIASVRYVLAGRGDDLDRLKRLADELGVADCVIFTGYVPDDELPAYYNLCDLFAMPSSGEGFGIVFLEAAASGKPSLAGNKDGSVDAVLNGELGVLVDPDDLDGIARSIVSVLSRTHPNRTLYEPNELRRRAIEDYGFETFAERVREVVEPFLTTGRI